MRSLKNLKIDESIRRKKLVFEEGWMEHLDSIALYVLAATLILGSILAIKDVHSNSQNDRIVVGILCTLGCFGMLLFYRKLMEKKLITIRSKFDAKEIKAKLLQFAVEENFEIYKQKGYCLILNESIGIFNGNHKKTRIIFIRDNVVYLTVIQDNDRLNRPVLTTHLFLKHSLHKLLN